MSKPAIENGRHFPIFTAHEERFTCASDDLPAASISFSLDWLSTVKPTRVTIEITPGHPGTFITRYHVNESHD